MITILDPVWDAEQDQTYLNLEKEYNKVSQNDPNVIALIDAGLDALAELCTTDIDGQTFVTREEAGEVLQKTILSYRHLIISSYEVRRLERSYERELKESNIQGSQTDQKKSQDMGENKKEGFGILTWWENLWATLIS